MQKVILTYLKKLIVHITSLFALFIVMIALLDNKNTMIITMQSDQTKPLVVELYYTKEGIAFNSQNKSHVYKVKNNQYYIKLPDLRKMEYARLDPSNKVGNIDIARNIQIISSKWFRTKVKNINIKRSTPNLQISEYIITKKGVSFKSTGKDPQINLNLFITSKKTSKNMHIDTLIIALLMYITFLYMYRVYKREEFSEKLFAKIILYFLFFFFSLFKVDYYKEHVTFDDIPDTVAHLSYIQHLHHTHDIIPKFEDMTMVTNPRAGNYLGHPPLYYYFMYIGYDTSYGLTQNYGHFRSLNVAIFLLSILLMLYIGFETKMRLIGHLAYLTVLTSIPMHAYLGSAITNDNLAILGGVIFLVGLQSHMQKHYTTYTYFMIGLGMFIAFFSKLTAALLIFFATIFYIFYMIKNKSFPKIKVSDIVILGIFLVPIFGYQAYILMEYHALIPTLNITRPDEYLTSVYYIPEAERGAYKTPLEWAGEYWSYMHKGWFGIYSHYSLFKQSIIEYIGLFTLHIVALGGLFFHCKDDDSKYCLLGKIGLYALIAVIIVQYSFSYNTHLNSGYMGGLQARYLLPFMVVFAIMASSIINKFSKNFFFSVLVILICIQALYSDFFYFLKFFH